jgi:hypothetical protein
MANFNQAAVTALQAAVISEASQLSAFGRVFAHEPRNAPGVSLTLALWLGPIRPVTTSGLANVSGSVTYMGRIYKSMAGANAKEDDAIDAAVLSALAQLYGAFSGGFTLGETVRNIDLFGMSATPGYLEQDGKFFRIVELVIPIIINDLWSESA